MSSAVDHYWFSLASPSFCSITTLINISCLLLLSVILRISNTSKSTKAMMCTVVCIYPHFLIINVTPIHLTIAQISYYSLTLLIITVCNHFSVIAPSLITIILRVAVKSQFVVSTVVPCGPHTLFLVVALLFEWSFGMYRQTLPIPPSLSYTSSLYIVSLIYSTLFDHIPLH